MRLAEETSLAQASLAITPPSSHRRLHPLLLRLRPAPNRHADNPNAKARPCVTHSAGLFVVAGFIAPTIFVSSQYRWKKRYTRHTRRNLRWRKRTLLNSLTSCEVGLTAALRC